MIEERDEGQAAVELALVLPLLVVLLLAVVQVALVARDQVLVVHAARSGAREAAAGADPAAVRRAAAEAGGLESGRLAVDSRTSGPGRDVVVTRVRFRVPTDVALVGPLVPDVVLEATASMRSEMSASTTLGGGRISQKQESPRRGRSTASHGLHTSWGRAQRNG